MLTEFGQELRMIRLACGDRILDMAEKLGETPAFISKLERGAIVLPGGFDEEVIKAYHLNKRRADQVRLAFKRTRAKEKQLTAPEDKSNCEKVITAYQLNKRRADQVRLAFKRTRAKEKLLIAPEDKSNWYFWSADEPYDKINENGPFATMKEAIVDAENKIRKKAVVLILKTCWLGSGQNCDIVAVACCEINSDAHAEEDDIFDKIEKRINAMSDSEREAMRKSIQQVGKTPTLIEQIPDAAWKDWDQRNEDAIVIDNTDEDDK